MPGLPPIPVNAWRWGVLASGRGSNAQALFRAIQSQTVPGHAINALATNNPQANVVDWANEVALPVAIMPNVNYETRQAQETAYINFFNEYGVNGVLLAGYTRIVSASFLSAFEGRVLNIHPSLLPRHGGVGMVGRAVHQSVLASGDKESGCTVHWVTDGVDEGPVLWQERVGVAADDTVETLAARVLAAEHRAFAQALRQLPIPH
ncbi:MAG: phosphoribosylglycinamide formyltransferase [Vampirovibrionales bacterium]